MRLLSGFLVALCLRCARGSFGPPHVDESARLAEVREVHQRLSEVLRHGSLRGELGKGARRVEDEAAAVLDSKVPDAAAVNSTLSDFKTWLASLKHRDSSLREGVAHQSTLGAEAKQLLSNLEQRVERVLAHLSAQTSANHAKERQVVVAALKAAVAAKGDSVEERVLQLHAALGKAHDFLLTETKDFTAEADKLREELRDHNATVLYKMLKQRRGLPMASQVALLRRQQFAGDQYAKELLKAHNTSIPLYMQLEGLLSQGLVHLLHEVPPKKSHHMEARGSEGRVHIVSSRMKESVRNMLGVMKATREKLANMTRMPATSANKGELDNAKKIIVSLDHVLEDVSNTHDLTKQMDALDGMRSQLDMWMSPAVAKGHA